ncbi:MAG: ribonuclease III [Anaerolineales bacterium]|nr:ribonuclease III [Anaerolineales bacterium]
MTDLEALQKSIGYNFNNPGLLLQALTHSSSRHEKPELIDDNERLEFLGDEVINFVATSLLVREFTELSEGELTWLRSILVRNEQLSHLANKFALGQQIILGHGEEDSGGRERNSILADTFEALVGAIYLDSDVQRVGKFLEPLLLQEARKSLEDKSKYFDHKSQLQEWAQSTLGETPRYVTIAETGPDHDKELTVELIIGRKSYSIAKGKSKKQAEQSAARIALGLLMKYRYYWRFASNIKEQS